MTALPPISAANYMNRYLRMPFWPESDPTALVAVRQYLMNDGELRAQAASKAKDALLAQVMLEIKWKNYASPPATFTVGWSSYQKEAVTRAFTGKGSPDQISDVLRLAHRFGFISNSARKPPQGLALSAQQYCDKYLGLDCNGFVSNYFGLNPDKMIGEYDVNSSRRERIELVQDRDVLVWVKDKTNYPHIAVVDEAPPKGLSGGNATFNVVQASGKDGLGLHEASYSKDILTDKRAVYFEDPLRHARVYFLSPPQDARAPRP